jgi:hypothetical protein
VRVAYLYPFSYRGLLDKKGGRVVRLRWWSLLGWLVAGLGGAGLWLLATRVWPDPVTELAMLALLVVTLAGVTVPVAAYLNHRFARPGWAKHDPFRLLRQGTWVGLLGGLCGWLQENRTFSWTIAAVIAGVFTLMEAFFLTRDQG